MKEFTIEYFSSSNNIANSEGYYSEYSRCYECNYSSILTVLIQAAGRFSEYYASDLFIDWKSVLDYLTEYSEDEYKVFLFGFHKMGVDSNNYILYHANNGENVALYYRAIYRLEITKNKEECKMQLFKVTL